MSPTSLADYRSISQSARLPAFMRAAACRVGVSSLVDLSEDDLWAIHDAHRDTISVADGGASLLDVKVELASRIMRACCLCERRCGVDRTRGETGFCGAGSQGVYFTEQILWAEEAPLVPSHGVFFSGCNMRCRFCYASESVLDPTRGTSIEAEGFARLAEQRRSEGATNLNLIGGEPTVHLPFILQCLSRIGSPVPIVWNSNFYMSEETLRLLDGIVDLYLGDFRFGNDECAGLIGGVEGYVAAARRSFLRAGAGADLIVRHLVLPGHIECCLRPILEWMAAHMPETPFHLMFQYLPFSEALNDPILGRYLSPEEEEEAGRIVADAGLNTTQWNRPIQPRGAERAVGNDRSTATIAIRPDGRVGILYVNQDMLELTRVLTDRGRGDGRQR